MRQPLIRCCGILSMIALTSIGCSTGSGAEQGGEGAETAKADDAERSASESRAKASSERQTSKLPEPSGTSDDSGGAEESARCTVEEQDWKQIDFQDAPGLHRELSEASEKFASCLKDLPAGTKYFLAFQVEQGKVTSAEPADLSKLETRRLSDEERDAMVQCVESNLEDLALTAEAAESSYEVTHPFCAP